MADSDNLQQKAASIMGVGFTIGCVIGLAGLGMLTLAGALVIAFLRFGIRTKPLLALVTVAGLLIVGTFCALIGYRLVFQKHTRDGGLLTVTGWRTLGGIFASLSMLFIGSLFFVPEKEQIVPGIFSAFLLTAMCFFIAKKQRS